MPLLLYKQQPQVENHCQTVSPSSQCLAQHPAAEIPKTMYQNVQIQSEGRRGNEQFKSLG